MQHLLTAALIATMLFHSSASFAETFNLQCRDYPENPDFPNPTELRMNIAEQYAEYGYWGVASEMIDWGDNFIVWAQKASSGVGLFVYDRVTSGLIIESITFNYFTMTEDERNRWHGGGVSYQICINPFAS